ncbi:MAG: hypothetical protein NTY53_02090, partial [Kiritimatiellaeota bacterium]|nr:hypothetical protein [Kiritimatiellota bacterium]
QLYTLSFKIRRTEGAGAWALSVAVASTGNPGWRSLGLQEMVNVGSAWKTVTCAFEAAEDTDQAILQLTRFKVGRYELDDLSFQSGATFAFDAVKGFSERTVPSVTMSGKQFPPQARRDFVQFLFDVETRYWTGMANYVKSDLKAKPLISGTQLGYSPPYVQAKLDYVDHHAYWRHPTGGWISLTAKEPWMIGNDAMVNTLGNILHLAGQRVQGKPYTISEYNHPYPNQFGAEGQLTLATYGRLQGWNGIFQYSYNHYVNDYEPQAMPWCFFDLIARTDVLAHFPACAAIFLRGDVREARETVVASTTETLCRDKLVANRTANYTLSSQGYDAHLVLLHRTAVAFDGDKPAQPVTLPADQKIFVSDTGEITWNREQPDAAYLAVDTANTKLFTGFPAGRTIDLGGVTLSVGPTRLNWATVSLVSRKASGFGEQGALASILLAATGDAGNAGRVVKEVGPHKITLTDRGHAPMLAEGIPATVTLPSNPSRTTCYALDPHGDRKQPVPVEKSGAGSRIAIGPQYQTVWYEIEVR